MHNQIFQLFREFYKEHPGLLTTSIILSSTSYAIETIVLPMLLAEIFTNVKNKEVLTRKVWYFLGAMVFDRLLSWGASYLDSMIEPHLTNFLTYQFTKAVFREYDVEHRPIEVAIVMDKIRTVRIYWPSAVCFTSRGRSLLYC
jgi:hypothetical protein